MWPLKCFFFLDVGAAAKSISARPWPRGRAIPIAAAGFTERPQHWIYIPPPEAVGKGLNFLCPGNWTRLFHAPWCSRGERIYDLWAGSMCMYLVFYLIH